MAELNCVKRGYFILSPGKAETLDLGAGFLVLFDYGSKYQGLYEIYYWESKISAITASSLNSIVLTKSSKSNKVTIKAKDDNPYNIRLDYLFIGG